MSKKLYIYVIFIIAGFIFAPQSSGAEYFTPDWFSGEPVHQTVKSTPNYTNCKKEQRSIVKIYPRVYSDSDISHELCIYKAKGFEYAYYTRNYYAIPSWPGFGTFGEAGIAISVGGGEMRPVPELDYSSGDSQLYLGNSSSYLRQVRNSNWANELWFYKDIVSRLQVAEDGSFKIAGEPDYIYKDDQGNHLSAEGVGISENGRWITFDTPNVGVSIFDSAKLTVRRISDRYIKLPSTWPNPSPVTSVSNDGRYVVVGGWNVPTEIIVADESCGIENDTPKYYGGNQIYQKNCQYKDITDTTWSNSQPSGSAGYRAFRNVRMSADGSSFEYFDDYVWHIVYAENMRPLSDTRYLALGDSYASGEGDLSLDGKDYYVQGTNIYGDYNNNIPREMCHISKRSYPFLLAKSMQLNAFGSMNSVACSGAVTDDISGYDGVNLSSLINQNYSGQPTQGVGWGINAPRLQGIKNITELQNQAQSSFLPGRIQQVGFVQQTKPEVVSIMIGGNDMKFGDVMAECIGNIRIGIGTSCKYAGQEGRQELAQIIHDNYPKLVSTYNAIKLAGSKYTKVYVVGYPQLISSKSPVCATSLDQSERVSIVEAVNYANAVIKQAAAASGVNYIDISDALAGNELCSGGPKYQYITYLSQLTYSKLASEWARSAQARSVFDAKSFLDRGMQTDVGFLAQYMVERGTGSYAEFAYSPWTAFEGMAQQMIHPNAAGHEAIAHSIISHFGNKGLNECISNGHVTCADSPRAMLSAPGPEDYMKGIGLQSGKTYVNGDGPVSIENKIDGAMVNVGKVVKKRSDMVIRLITKPEWGKFIGTPRASLHSEPIDLGNMAVDGGGYVLSVHVPDDLMVGVHTVNVSGLLENGQHLVITKDIFVQGPAGDADDDGLNDINDSCVFGEPSGQDADKDGVDDNCDMNIEQQKNDPNASSATKRNKVEDSFIKDVGILLADSPLSKGDTGEVFPFKQKGARPELAKMDSGQNSFPEKQNDVLDISSIITLAMVALLASLLWLLKVRQS